MFFYLISLTEIKKKDTVAGDFTLWIVDIKILKEWVKIKIMIVSVYIIQLRLLVRLLKLLTILIFK